MPVARSTASAAACRGVRALGDREHVHVTRAANYFASDVPMGGWKESGIGYRHGAQGISKYCRTESLVITRFGGKREPTWYPYTRSRRGLVGRLAALINARDWKRRLGLRR